MVLEFISIFYMIEDADSSDKKCLKDRRAQRIALCQHHQSAFIYLFNPGNRQALLNCCAVDHKVFHNLLDLFQPISHNENGVWGAANGLKLKKVQSSDNWLIQSQYYNGWTRSNYLPT
eukprot:jgi/Psemu1/3003/gm1.3003_g